MYHYARPSFNTDLPVRAYDGLMAGSQRHTLNPNDLTIQEKKAEPGKFQRPDNHFDKYATTSTKPIAIPRKKGKKKSKKKK